MHPLNQCTVPYLCLILNNPNLINEVLCSKTMSYRVTQSLAASWRACSQIYCTYTDLYHQMLSRYPISLKNEPAFDWHLNIGNHSAAGVDETFKWQHKRSGAIIPCRNVTTLSLAGLLVAMFRLENCTLINPDIYICSCTQNTRENTREVYSFFLKKRKLPNVPLCIWWC